MGQEQSSSREGTAAAAEVLQSPTTAALRSGAMSPRQGSVCSDTDPVPYVSYTVNKPIGDSPKKTGKGKVAGRFSSPRLVRSARPSRLSQSQHNTLVTVNQGGSGAKADLELVRLQEIPSFLPVMPAGGGGAEQAELLSRLDSGPLCRLLQRYEDHLRTCATRVAADQGRENNLQWAPQIFSSYSLWMFKAKGRVK